MGGTALISDSFTGLEGTVPPSKSKGLDIREVPPTTALEREARTRMEQQGREPY